MSTDYDVAEFKERLAEVIEPSAIDEWMVTPNPAFEGRQPLQLFRDGDADRLWDMLHQLRSGEPA